MNRTDASLKAPKDDSWYPLGNLFNISTEIISRLVHKRRPAERVCSA